MYVFVLPRSGGGGGLGGAGGVEGLQRDSFRSNVHSTEVAVLTFQYVAGGAEYVVWAHICTLL